MQRRGESGQPVKGRRTLEPKARKTPTKSASTDQSPEQFDQLKRERDEALEQLAATTEILRVIRASPTDAQPVFETIVRNAASLCGSLFANVFRFDGELLHFGATSGGQDYADMIGEKYPMRPDSSQISGRVLLTKSVVWLEDALTDPDYDKRYPLALGWRRVLGVPMLRGSDPIGVIVVAWAEPGPPSKGQEELLKTFADQAVIAIENVRLFEAEQQRTRELSESLEQQTATAEVLSVISSSMTDAQPVFEVIARSAARACNARLCHVFRFDGELIHLAATHGYEGKAIESIRRAYPVRPGRDSAAARAILDATIVQIPDIEADPEYRHVDAARDANYRSVVAVPMLKGGRPSGAIVLGRPHAGTFPERQIELLKIFADQAVIAIENARLLKELRQRTHELSASLDNLRATQDRLVQTEKLASLGQLTAGIAHEIKNPLNFVNNFSGISTELIGELQNTLSGLAATLNATELPT
jgi:GAF domain-containing protein